MRTVGLIVEYNPLHNGHAYHFEQSMRAAKADASVAVMSGHFLQRGEPALLSKWARAEMALSMGVDVVLELPVAYSSQPAEWFAYGAACLLDATGVVDSVCFGSENGDIGWLKDLAAKLAREPDELRDKLRERLDAGLRYPDAFSGAVEEWSGDMTDGRLRQPNNTLGLHYLIALQRLGSRIEPLTITRTKAGYSQQDVTDKSIASATAIRKLLFEASDLESIRPYVPSYTLNILRREWENGRAPIGWNRYFNSLLHDLVKHSESELADFAEVSEGLEYRIKQALPSLDLASPRPFEQLLDLIKSKRYTRTKLQRTLLRILLGHRKQDLSRDALFRGPSCLRVLGFSEKGRELLRRMKKQSRLPIVTKVTRGSCPFLDMDIRATSVYALGYDRRTSRDLFRDYYEPPIRVPEP